MASKTKRTELIRARKEKNRGKARKRKERTQGSTLPAAQLFGDE